MPNALIYSPELDGHRQVHVFVMTHILQELGFNIFIAGNLQKKITNTFYIDKLKERPEITIINTDHYLHGGLNISPAEFLALQSDCNTDLTIFAEADHHIPLFVSQIFNKKNKLKGKVIATFMRPFFYYKKSSFLDKLRLIKHFPSRWNTDEALFYKFFLKRFSLLDTALTLDENLVNNNKLFRWLPDVFQQFADKIVKQDENSGQRIWIKKLNSFLDKNRGRFNILYFGTAQERRGYDTLLQLAEETDSCFIHCGLQDSTIQYSINTEEIISHLEKEGRYFHTNEFIEDPTTIEHFFKSVSHIVLPYKDFLGSSGVMLQALEYGIPILAPDTAIIGYRILKYNLGYIYDASNISTLKSQFKIFKETDPSTFEESIKAYMELQSTKQLKNAYINSFTDSKLLMTIP
ncbi:MAG: hypothetical protein ABIN48_10005 [Ginsengibacter sp.]